MESSTTLPNVAVELQQHIGSFLDFHDRHSLRATCKALHESLKTFTKLDLFAAEMDWDGFAAQNNLWSCYDCQRVRPARFFADSWRKTPKGRDGPLCHKRFCVECGSKISPNNPESGVRYHKGIEVIIMKKIHVVCPRCNNLRPSAGIYEGQKINICDMCFMPQRTARDTAKAKRALQKERIAKARAREELAERHKAYRDVWGSDTDFDDDIPDSPTSQEVRDAEFDAMYALVMNDVDPFPYD